VFIGVALAIAALAIVARLAVTGVGPFPATLDSVTARDAGLDVTLTVTNSGSAAGQTTCRVTTATNQGGGPNAFVLSPNLEPGQTATFSQLVTELGTSDTDLVVDCRTP
jgi:hypothetical protein